MDLNEAKKKLDIHIGKQRTHMYKPIQVAEILRADRLGLGNIDLNDLNTYRTPSRRWRNDVSQRLVGSVSTSSAGFQDNLFELTAIPPIMFSVLAKENNEKDGIVESYIYHRFKERLGMVEKVSAYTLSRTHKDFSLDDFLDVFHEQEGLRKSIDKIYEIIVYALFYTVIKYLDVEIQLNIKNFDTELMSDFDGFNKKVLGINDHSKSTIVKANVYRVGVTNAADKGLDMWSNFGPVIQVKHLSLTEDLSEEITSSIKADQIVIACREAEQDMIESLLTQIGWRNRIQGIVTEKDLIYWYDLCFTKYSETLGKDLLENIKREFTEEFPFTVELESFLLEREYSEEQLTEFWSL